MVIACVIGRMETMGQKMHGASFIKAAAFQKNWFNLLQLQIKSLTECFLSLFVSDLSLWMVYLWMVARKTSLLLANGEVSGAKHASSHFRVPLDFVEIVLCWLMPGKSDICFWRGCSHWLFWVCGQALMETAVGKRLRQKIVVLMRKSQSMRTKRGACETSVIELWTSALVFEMVPGHLSFRGNPTHLV